jgi:hypothetical protein
MKRTPAEMSDIRLISDAIIPQMPGAGTKTRAAK